MENQNQDDKNLNWLETAVDEQSIEKYQKSMMEVFHRMRVVDRLFLSEQSIKHCNGDADKIEAIIYPLMSRENDIRIDSIKESSPVSIEPVDAAWYEPFDLSEEVIKEGVDWYLKMRNGLGEDHYVISKYLEELNRQLYLNAKADKSLSALSHFSSSHFSDVVTSLVSKEIYFPIDRKKVVGQKEDEDIITKKMRGASKAESKFVDSIRALSDEFNRIYSKQVP